MAKVGAQPGAPPPRLVWYNDWRQVAAPALEAFTPELPVSVIVPYYAQPQELARTLAALEGQTYPRDLFEVVVVDDGSPEPLARPRSTPLDLKVARQEDLGFGAARARNTGVRAAAHDVLLFLDADMLPEADWLAAHARWHHAVPDALTLGLRAHVPVDGVDAGMIRNRPGTLRELFAGRKADPAWFEPFWTRRGDLRSSKADDLFRAVASGNLGIRRGFYDLVGGFDESFTEWGGEDVEFGYRAYVRGGLMVPLRDGFAWHQGPWEEGREEKDRSWMLLRAKLTHLIAHPVYRTRLTGRTFTVPQYVVTIEGGGLAGETSAGSGRAHAVRSGARSGGAAGVARRPCRPGVAGAPFGPGPQGAGGAELQGGGRALPHGAGGVSRVPVPGRAACGVAAAWGHGAHAARRTGDRGCRAGGVSRRRPRVDLAGVGAASGVAHAMGGRRLRRSGDHPGPEACAASTGGRKRQACGWEAVATWQGLEHSPARPPPRLVWYNDWRQVAAPALEAFTPELPVSVIVPYYAQPQELARTLAALEGQTYPRDLFEVVVVDDGSPQPLARPRSTPLDLRVARQEDLGFGLARARNTGARAAAHDVLLFLDADMLPEAHWLAAHARWHHAVPDAVTLGLRAHVSVDGVDAGMIRNRPGTLKELFAGRKVDPAWFEPYWTRRGDLRSSKADDLFRWMVGSNLGVRRGFYELVGGFDESFTEWGGEDVEFGYRAYVRGGLLVAVAGPAAAAAVHQGPAADAERPELELEPDVAVRRSWRT